MTTLRSKVSRSSLEKETLLQAKTEKVEMTLNTDNAIASGLLIQRLTELYEDPVEASVRETVSNALDAVVESFSGETPEIHITTPSTLNPVFSVRDNGVGMSYNDLKEIYSKYGASTKMNNFDQIGAYGLGAKAPLAYGTEFTVSSVKDGERTTIIVAREELTNYIKIVDSVQTDEPSGTTVSIPVTNYDIERFQKHVAKYQENPVDKNVKMFVNGEEIVESEYVQITDDMVIFRKEGEEITGRLWIKKDQHTIVNLISNMSEDDVRRSLQYLIGGWSYSSPSRRNSYYRSNNGGLMVELKAGIVGFNSARDAILENDRYNDLENLVIEYIKSEKFMEKLTETVNDLELENFKSIVVSLLKRNENRLYIKDGEIRVEDGGGSHYNTRIARNYSISDFIHNETGFRFDHMLKGVPKAKKQSAAILESKVSYRKTVSNSILTSYANPGEDIKHKRFVGDNVSEILQDVDSIMYGTTSSHSLESLMLNLALTAYTKESKNMRITFITDIEADVDDKKSTNYSKVRSGRKTIIRMRNADKHEGEYNSYLIYTQHDKASIEKMLEEAKFDDLDVVVYTAEEAIDKMSEYRKNNRTTSERTINKDLTTSLQKFNQEKNSAERVSVNDIEVDDDKVNVILVSKEGYVSDNEMKMVHAWYCNENNLMPEEVELYSSVGQHRVVDIKILSELGELYENPRSRYAGSSKLYSETVGNNVAKMHTINENDKEVEKKAFIRLLSGMLTSSPSSVTSKITSTLEDAYRTAAIAGVEMPELPNEMLKELGEYGDTEFGQSYSGRYWQLENSATKHLLENIKKDKYDLIESLVSLNSSTRIDIKENGEFTTSYLYNSSTPERSQVTVAYDEENKDSSYYKMVRLQTEAYLEYITSVVNELLTIKF